MTSFTKYKTLSTNLLALFVVAMAILISCEKDQELPVSETLKIDSLVVSRDTIIAWDTSIITVYAKGADLRYEWAADKGTIIQTSLPNSVRFSACESCKGHRQIICTVIDSTGTASDTAWVFVKSYFPGS